MQTYKVKVVRTIIQEREVEVLADSPLSAQYKAVDASEHEKLDWRLREATIGVEAFEPVGANLRLVS
jgi:hypothetical protein